MKRHNDRKISDILDEFVHKKKIEKGFWQKKIEMTWEQHMGTSINAYTRKITFYKGNLTVQLSSASLRHELSQNKAKLVQLLNDKIGEKVIEKIRLT